MSIYDVFGVATDLLIKRNGLPQSRHSGKKPMS